jgi:glycyl-tRNA synthetase
MRKKIPFGIAQIGKAFRNEITPGHLTYRTREFEQMEMQYFIHPEMSKDQMNHWKQQRLDWYLHLGVTKEKIRLRQHEEDERAHYAKDAFDIEYETPFGGWQELAGIHDRGNWDLSRHSEFSGKSLEYFDNATQEKYIPHIIETSDGVDRAALMFLIDAYTEIEGGRTKTTESKKEKEVVLRFHKDLAPIKIAILPLSKKQDLQKLSQGLQENLSSSYMTMYDETGSIGKRYRRQDEIGTPYCVTVDFDSLEDRAVTVRDRDTMEQERIKIEELGSYFEERFR